MPRIPQHSYRPTTPEAIATLRQYSNDALAHCLDAASTPADPALLLVGLPQGPITSARLIEGWSQGTLVSFNIKDRNARYIEPAGFNVLRALTLFGCGVHIDTNERGKEGQHYIEVGFTAGVTLFRVLANALSNEVVRQDPSHDHHYLNAASLSLVAGTGHRGRREAREEALKAYDLNAVGWGLGPHMTRRDYEALIGNAFRLYDLRHAVAFLRPIPDPLGLRS